MDELFDYLISDGISIEEITESIRSGEFQELLQEELLGVYNPLANPNVTRDARRAPGSGSNLMGQRMGSSRHTGKPIQGLPGGPSGATVTRPTIRPPDLTRPKSPTPPKLGRSASQNRIMTWQKNNAPPLKDVPPAAAKPVSPAAVKPAVSSGSAQAAEVSNVAASGPKVSVKASEVRPPPVLGSGANLPGSTTGGGVGSDAFKNPNPNKTFAAANQGKEGTPSGPAPMKAVTAPPPELITAKSEPVARSVNAAPPPRINHTPSPARSKPTFRTTGTSDIGSHMSRVMGGLGEGTINQTQIKESFESFLRNRFLVE